MYVDNTAAIAIAKNPISNRSTKHIDLRHHYLRELYENKIMVPVHVSTTENVADTFTKPLGDEPFSKFHRRHMHIGPVPS